jgi:hypothetical protein
LTEELALGLYHVLIPGTDDHVDWLEVRKESVCHGPQRLNTTDGVDGIRTSSPSCVEQARVNVA